MRPWFQFSRFKGLEGKKALAMFVTIFALVFGFIRCAETNEKNLPFSPGEKLTLQVRWGFIKAGEVVLEVLSPKVVEGVKSHHFKMTLRTSPLVDCFYKMRDRIDSFVDMDMAHSILYKKKKQGHKKKDVRVCFNWEKKEVQYSNFGEKRTPIALLPGSLDPLSVFYAFRACNMEDKREIERAVTDGKKCIVGRLNIVKREKIRLAGKIFDSYLVEPELKHLDGIFEKSKDAELKIWITTDSQHVPLKIKSSVVVGSFVGELVSATGLRDSDF